MKNSMLKVVFLIVPLISFWGCQNTTNELNESEKDSITKEVRSEFDKAIAAASNHDADAMMQIHWNSTDYMYVGHGAITKGWESMLKGANSIHSNPKYQSFTVDLDEVIIRVINREAAMVTAGGYFNNFPTEEGPRSIKLALTCLMQKIDGNWVVTNGHESTQEALFNL
jgi:uncharacterized protein (TIGR02246 family)